MSTLYILRGPPGSTKSTTARALRQQVEEDRYHGPYRNFCTVSADFYWERPDGLYDWNPKNVGRAHAWALQECREALISGITDVCVDNTNIRLKEMAPYESLASQFGYEVKYIVASPSWGWNPQACFEKCIHGVPLEVIQRMIETYEPRPGEVDPRPLKALPEAA